MRGDPIFAELGWAVLSQDLSDQGNEYPCDNLLINQWDWQICQGVLCGGRDVSETKKV